MLLAALATGCNKESNVRLRLAAENMRGDEAKVLVDPSAPDAASAWIENEPINLNGTVYYVSGDASTGFYLSDASSNEVSALNETMYALYLGESNGMNDVTVTNTASEHEIVLNRLAIDLQSDGKQKIAFPMAAKAASSEDLLLFRHLCAGFKVTLTAATAVSNLSSLKIIAQGNMNSAMDMGIENSEFTGFGARWAVQGPTVPSGSVGGNSSDVDAKYSSEMNFVFTSTPTVTSTGISFMVPVTISSVNNLIVVGYNSDGVEIFRKSKSFTSPIAVERNQMYSLPSIAIN